MKQLPAGQVPGVYRRNVAGLIDRDGRATFPRAELVAHEDEVAFWPTAASVSRSIGEEPAIKRKSREQIEWTPSSLAARDLRFLASVSGA
jgi:hypothetical protein